MARSDARKLTACREVGGFYKPCNVKSRPIDIAEASMLQPFLAPAGLRPRGICDCEKNHPQAPESRLTAPRSRSRAEPEPISPGRVARPELPATALIKGMPVYQRLTRLSRKSTLDQCFRPLRCHFRRSIRTIEPLRLAPPLLSLSQVYVRVPICTPVILKRHSCVRRLPSFSTDRPAYWRARPRATPCWSTRFGRAPGSVRPGRIGDSPQAAESCGP